MAKKSPKPPKVAIPQPSAEEIALQKAQSQLIAQMTGQQGVAFNQAQADRGMSDYFLGQLKDGKMELSDTEKDLAQQLSSNFYDMGLKGLTTGANKDIFNQNQRDTLGGLVNAGVVNSSTGTELLGALHKDLLSRIQDIGMGSAQQQLLLQKDFLDKKLATNLNLFSALRGGSMQGSQLSGQLGTAALSGAGALGGQYRQNRMDAYNATVGNQQSQYAWQLSNFNRSAGARSGLGGTLGSIGGALIGSAIPGVGTALGGMLGGGLGSSIGGFF